MVSVFIHAGSYKTATSTIQSIAQKNRDLFLRQFGALYPQTGLRANQGATDPDSVAHHLLFHAARSAVDPATTTVPRDRMYLANKAKLRDEVSAAKCDRVLVSTEVLAFAGNEVKPPFLGYFEGIADQVSIIYVIRRPDQMIDSMNNQMLKAGRSRIRRKEDWEYLEYKVDIDQWTSLLSRDRVKVLYFSPSRYESYLQNFFAMAGIDVTRPGVATDVYVNAPMTVAGHVIRSMIFGRLKKRNIELDREIRHEINVALAPIEKRLSPSPKIVTLSHDDRMRILERNREDMDAIRDYLSPADRAALDEDLRQAMAGPHPDKNLETLPAFSRNDLDAVVSGLLANERLRELFAKD